MKSTRRGSFSVRGSEKTPGSKYSSTSGLSPRGHLERQAEFHSPELGERACGPRANYIGMTGFGLVPRPARSHRLASTQMRCCCGQVKNSTSKTSCLIAWAKIRVWCMFCKRKSKHRPAACFRAIGSSQMARTATVPATLGSRWRNLLHRGRERGTGVGYRFDRDIALRPQLGPGRRGAHLARCVLGAPVLVDRGADRDAGDEHEHRDEEDLVEGLHVASMHAVRAFSHQPAIGPSGVGGAIPGCGQNSRSRPITRTRKSFAMISPASRCHLDRKS